MTRLATFCLAKPGLSVLSFSLALSCCLALAPQARAVTPESPEVKKVLKKAFKYLSTADDARLGGKCLIALCYVKDGASEKHPKVAAAIAACKASAQPDPKAIGEDIYSTGIAIIFLCTVNPSKYSAEITKFYKSLEYRQKKSGGWGYPDDAHKETGDTSMTQYGVLSTWEMQKAGFHVSLSSIERVADWLIRTQAPGGNWGYQGVVAEGDPPRAVKQDQAGLGLTAAGLGSSYIVADLLKITNLGGDRDDDLPPALKLVKKGEKQKAVSKKIDSRLILQALERGNAFFQKGYKIDPPGFTHYYLYALERYQSFREASRGKFIKEPKWYNDGFAWLKKTQKEDGSWKSGAGEQVDTAFAVLFLLRSAKKSIEHAKAVGDGAMLAGRGLPQNAQEVKLQGAKIVSKAQSRTAEELIALLDKPEGPEFIDLYSNPLELTEQIDPTSSKQRSEQLSQLRATAANGSADARLVAMTVLGQSRDMDNGPALIAGLDDGDWRVVREAHEGLLLLSQKLADKPLAEQPDETARQAAVKQWKTWYLAIRPDADFEN